MSSYRSIAGISFDTVAGAPVAKGRGSVRGTGKYAGAIEAAQTVRRGAFIKVTATNTKGARLAAAVRAALKNYYKGTNEANKYTVMTTADSAVAIVRNR